MRKILFLLLTTSFLAQASQAVQLTPEEEALKRAEVRPDIDRILPTGNTHLTTAALEENLPKVKELLQAGADVNATDLHDQTPILMAAHKLNIAIMEELFRHGAELSIHQRSKRGFQALSAAIHSSYNPRDKETTVNLLFRHGAGESAHQNAITLLVATQHNETEILERLFSCSGIGAIINDPDKDGDTALLNASRHQNNKAVSLLAAKGANVNHANKKGETPLYHALRYPPYGDTPNEQRKHLRKEVDLVLCLRSHGARVDRKSSERAFLWGVRHGDVALIDKALEYQPALIRDFKDRFNGSPWHNSFVKAVENNDTDIMHVLLERGGAAPFVQGEIRPYSRTGEHITHTDITPITHARDAQNEDALNLMVSYGASPHDAFPHRKTSLV